MKFSGPLFIDDLNGQWYVVEAPRRDAWMHFKRLNPKFESTVRVETGWGWPRRQRNPELPDYASPIGRNLPRAVTFIGVEGVEEWT